MSSITPLPTGFEARAAPRRALAAVEYVGVTDVGRRRDTNEDAYVTSPGAFAVADGMGGAAAGEVAARMAVEAFSHGEWIPGTAEDRLAAVVADANRRIYEQAHRDRERRGMGTTLAAAVVEQGHVAIANVGDSRVYRLREGRLERLTRDHSLVAELVESGEIGAEAAARHPLRSVLTRVLGPQPEIEADIELRSGRPGDVYLLCSDGLTSMLADDLIAAMLTDRDHGSLAEAADALVAAANEHGGDDNVTVVLFRLDHAGARAVRSAA